MSRRHLGWFLPAVAYAALIFYLSSQPSPLPGLTHVFNDKLLHGVEYAGLAGLLVLGLTRVGWMRPWRTALLAILLASLYGASDELHQSFVPNRDCNAFDWLADTLGAILGGLSAVPFLRRFWARASIRA